MFKIIITIKRIAYVEKISMTLTEQKIVMCSSVTMLHGPRTVGANQTELVTTLTPDTLSDGDSCLVLEALMIMKEIAELLINTFDKAATLSAKSFA